MPDSSGDDRQEPSLNQELKRVGFKVWSYKMGEQVALMIHLGERLGIYRELARVGPSTSSELAEAANLDERFVREWLLGQAAAGLVERNSDEVYELSLAQQAILADETDSLAFAAGAFRGGVAPAIVDKLAESFQTGQGITYEEQGPAAAAGLARMTGPWSRLALKSIILPALDGVVDKLTEGASVVDVGCGGGVTLTTIAAGFPDTQCVGYDPSSAAIDLATESSNAQGLDNVEFILAGGEDLPAGSNFDLVCTFDCLHDMPFPDRTAAAVRSAIAPDGTWLIKDIRSTGDFEKDSRNPLLAMFYGFSVASCLQSATSEPGGLGLGTLGLYPERVESLVRDAGFSQFMVHDLDDAANLYYEVKP